MRILNLYLAKEFLKLFCFLILAFVMIYNVFDFIEKVDNFYEAGLPISATLTFLFLQIPAITALLVPVAVLMATILTLGFMGSRNELVAVKSSGISLIRFTLPIVLISTSLALGVAMLNEMVVPYTKAQTNYIWDVQVQKRPSRLYQKEKFWYKGQNSVYQIGFYDEQSHSLSNVVYYRFDRDFNLDLRVDARRARYLGGRWIFFSGLYQKRLSDGGYTAEVFSEKEVELPEHPMDFSLLAKPSDEMSFAELTSFVNKMENEGYDTRRYQVDLQAKISFPFVSIIMALLGIPLALSQERGKQNIATGVLAGLGAALIYWIAFSYLRSVFGYSGILPPLLAAWMPNIIFGLAGMLMFTNIKQ